MSGLMENRITTLGDGDESIDVFLSQNTEDHDGKTAMMAAQFYDADNKQLACVWLTAEKARELMNHLRAFLKYAAHEAQQ